MIHELVVYDGATKVFRILNLYSGTVYSSEYETLELAKAAIDHGEKRAGMVVNCTTLEEINEALAIHIATKFINENSHCS